jgi:cell division protein FtsB
MKNMIYISKAEYEKLADSRTVLEYENKKLKRELAWLKKFAFGKKARKSVTMIRHLIFPDWNLNPHPRRVKRARLK